MTCVELIDILRCEDPETPVVVYAGTDGHGMFYEAVWIDGADLVSLGDDTWVWPEDAHGRTAHPPTRVIALL